MTLRTDISKKHLLRLTAVACVCLGFSGWSYYDGKYAWPAQRERALKYQELEDFGELEKWPEVAAENGWEPYNPGEPKKETDIQLQFYMVGIAGIPGLLVLINVLRSLGRWIEMDDKCLRSSRGEEVPLDAITQIDKKRWDKKGIAKVHYQANGSEKKFTLDDFIYERPTTDEILRQLELRVGFDKIVNGKPEPDPNAKPKQPPQQPAESQPAAEQS